jgi:tRNA threonylcarbamoyladenosine biosynthesis protein TsaE
MNKSIVCKTIKDFDDAAKIVLNNFKEKKFFAIYGNMGAGKTLFIKFLCKNLGTKDIVTSPTFSIVNEYKRLNSDSIYHFDFFRINKLEEVYDIGYEDYFFSNAYCFIEWPEKVETLLPKNTVKIIIEKVKNNLSDDDRIIKF